MIYLETLNDAEKQSFPKNKTMKIINNFHGFLSTIFN